MDETNDEEIKKMTYYLDTGTYTAIEGAVTIEEVRKTRLVLKMPPRKDPMQNLLPFEEAVIHDDSLVETVAVLETIKREDGSTYVVENTDPKKFDALIAKAKEIEAAAQQQ